MAVVVVVGVVVVDVIGFVCCETNAGTGGFRGGLAVELDGVAVVVVVDVAVDVDTIGIVLVISAVVVTNTLGNSVCVVAATNVVGGGVVVVIVVVVVP